MTVAVGAVQPRVLIISRSAVDGDSITCAAQAGVDNTDGWVLGGGGDA